MKRVGCWVCGAVLVMAIASCGGGGGKAVSNSNWQLYPTQGAQGWAPHRIQGTDGEFDNGVDCSIEGRTLRVTLFDAGQPLDLDDNGEIDVRERNPSTLFLEADLEDLSRCSVEVSERAQGEITASEPEYLDSCPGNGTGGTCQLNLVMQEEGSVMGTLRCTGLRQRAATADTPPLILAAARGEGQISGSGDPLAIGIQNCK